MYFEVAATLRVLVANPREDAMTGIAHCRASLAAHQGFAQLLAAPTPKLQ